MALNPTYPTIEELLPETSTYPPIRRFIDADGIQVSIFLQPGRIYLYRDEEQKPFATLRFGGPHSGAIWINDELAGEYERSPSGQFIVTEIAAGFRKLDSRREQDPISHLIEVLHETRSVA